MLPIILGVSAVGVLIALLMGGKKADGGGGGGGGGDGGTAGLRTRVIDSSTQYPGTFATKWGGSFSKWTELPGVNPGVHRVWKNDVTGAWQDFDPGCTRTNDDGTSSVIDCPSGLSPWAIGQTVNLPTSWPG